MASFEGAANFGSGSTVGSVRWFPATTQTIILPAIAPPSALAVLRSTNSSGVTEWTTESAPQRLVLGSTTTQTLTAASTINTAASVACLVSSASAVTLTSGIQISGTVDRQVITIVNVGSFAITIANGNGNLSGQAITLLPTKTVTLIYLTSVAGWVRLDSTVLDTPSPVWTNATLLNSFVNASGLDASYQDVQYSLAQGFVEIRGACYRSWPFAANLVMFTLPVGFRPLKRVTLYSPALYTGAATSENHFRVDVLTNGDVIIFTSAAPASGTCFALLNGRFAPN